MVLYSPVPTGFTGAIRRPEGIPDLVSYNFDIRPILSDKCLACHGPDANKREAGLRLDMAESAYKALKEHPSAHALVPGKPELSQVFLRITSPGYIGHDAPACIQSKTVSPRNKADRKMD